MSDAPGPADPSPPPQSAPWRAFLLVSLAGASFVGLAATIKLAAPEVGVAAPIFSRGATGVLVCLAWAAWRGRLAPPRAWGALLTRSLAGVAAMGCYYGAIGNLGTELGTASMLLKTAPLWVALLAPLALGEPTSRRVWLALGLGLLGVALAYGGIPQGERAGIAACLLGGVLSAVAYISLRRLARSDDPVTVVLTFSVCTALLTLPLLGQLPGQLARSPDPGRLLLQLGLVGVLGTAGQLFLTAAYRWASAAAVTIGGLGEVAMATAVSLALFQQAPRPGALAGGVLAMGAGLLAAAGPRAPRPLPSAASR